MFLSKDTPFAAAILAAANFVAGAHNPVDGAVLEAATKASPFAKDEANENIMEVIRRHLQYETVAVRAFATTMEGIVSLAMVVAESMEHTPFGVWVVETDASASLIKDGRVVDHTAHFNWPLEPEWFRVENPCGCVAPAFSNEVRLSDEAHARACIRESACGGCGCGSVTAIGRSL